MSESYLGEIRLFSGNYAPQNWALCNGQLIAIAGNEALFSLLGSVYGGDGRTNFALPDFRGRVPVHFGQGPPISGPPLTNRLIGSRSGQPSVTLTLNEIPNHTHPMQGSGDSANTTSPSGTVLATVDGQYYEPEAEANNRRPFPDAAVGETGNAIAHENHMATLTVNYIISMKGAFPSRN